MKADLIIKNGNLFASDKDSIVIKERTIIAVAAAEETAEYEGEGVRIIDAGGNSVNAAEAESVAENPSEEKLPPQENEKKVCK